MIYRPALPRRLWDTWLFPWQGTYHLFYLETQETLWDHVGHAVSTDLAHWEARASIPTKGKPGEWNHEPTLTGMVVRHDGRFYMFVGASHHDVQVVGLYTSDDLDHWTPHPGNPVLCPVGPHYLDRPPNREYLSADWRDPCVTFHEDDGHYHALLCARRPQSSHADTGAVVAHLRSRDLVHWEALPPIDAPTGQFFHTEVPDIFALDGRYYLAFATLTTGGIRLDPAGREQVTGTFYMIADRPEGPFRLPDDYLLIGAGQARMQAYVGRTIPFEGGRLLYHHVQADRPAWAVPKRIRANADGSLYLQYLPIIEKLETGVVETFAEPQTRDWGLWGRHNDTIVGRAGVVGSGALIAPSTADLHFAVTIRAASAERAGVAIRADDKSGVVVALDFRRRRLEILQTGYAGLAGWGPDLGAVICRRGNPPHDLCSHDLQPNRDYRLRVLARDEHFEIYLDDRWIFTAVLPDAAKTGDVHLTVEHGEALFSNLRLAALEPLA